MEPGALIDHRYQLEARIGSGGMAEVWRAADTKLNRPTALKFLAARFSDDPDNLVRFFTEAQSLARIQHPNVVTVLDFGAVDGRPFLVMEYISGGTLADRMGRPLDPHDSVGIIQAIAAAAGAAHAIDIVHRDVKPGNILIADGGRPKLADFGIASYSGAERLTVSGVAVGSPSYISPEQATDKAITARSDVYSLGVVLYEMLAGRRPFERANLPAVVIAHVEERPQPPSTHVPAIPPELDALVMKCLAKDPALRFGDGNDLARALDRVAESPSPSDTSAAGAPLLDHRADQARGDREAASTNLDTASIDLPGAAGADADEGDDSRPGLSPQHPVAARLALATAVAVAVIAAFLLLGLRGGGTSPEGSGSSPRSEVPNGGPRIPGEHTPAPAGVVEGSPVESPAPEPTPTTRDDEDAPDRGSHGAEEPSPSPTPTPDSTPTPPPTPSTEETAGAGVAAVGARGR